MTVVPVDQAPTLNAITNPAPFTEFINSPTVVPPLPAAINLAGITAGQGDSQNLTVTAVVEPSGTRPGQRHTNPTSSPACRRLRSVTNPDGSITPNVVTGYSPNNTTGTLNYTLAPLQSGTAVIAVTVTDDGSTANGGVNTITQTFTVTVTAGQPAAHDQPDHEPGAGRREYRRLADRFP